MAFTYDTANPGSREYVRFHLRDTTSGSGPLPDDDNFSNAELDMMLAEEGTWQRAVAAGYEALAAAWFINPSWQADGLAVSQSHIGKNFADLGSLWRKRHGGAFGSTAFARSVIKVDGYSDDVRADTVS